jgi:trimethylamine--corrinoid protein Co-methyltransferase
MQFPPYHILSHADMQQLHEASLTILENTGMQIDHSTARRILHDAGAKIDAVHGIVKFPSELVQQSLKKIPRSLCLAGRNPENDQVLSCDSLLMARCAAGVSAVIDHQTDEYRDATVADQIAFAMVTDTLDHIDLMAPFTVHGVPPKTADLHATKILLEHQRKHFMNLTMGVDNLRYQIEMQLAVRGSREEVKKRPLFHPIACVISPLHLPEEDIANMMLAGDYGLPVKVPVMSMLGATTPVTFAGALAQTNAEIIGALSTMQILRPGNPTFYYFSPSIMDMRSGNLVYGSPENKLLYAALIQMGKEFYRLPTDTMAFACDGIMLEQAIYQKSTGILLAALAGANIVGGAGTLDGAMAAGLTQLVIDDEMLAMTRRFFEGFEINSEKMAFEVIQRIGPRGHFLTDLHTLENFRQENFLMPSIFNWQNYATWQDEKKGLCERAREKVAHILNEHEVPPLDDAVVRELDKILIAADKQIV